MEQPQSHEYQHDYQEELFTVFGEKGTSRLLSQIAHDNPSLTSQDVLVHAWSIISEATAYMMPADQETLTEAAIDVHEGYEAYRRIS